MKKLIAILALALSSLVGVMAYEQSPVQAHWNWHCYSGDNGREGYTYCNGGNHRYRAVTTCVLPGYGSYQAYGPIVYPPTISHAVCEMWWSARNTWRATDYSAHW